MTPRRAADEAETSPNDDVLRAAFSNFYVALTYYQSKTDLFTRALTAAAVLAPILLIVIAATRPMGSRGGMIVAGDAFIVGGLLAAIALRIVYGMGFSQARKLLRSGPNRSQTA